MKKILQIIQLHYFFYKKRFLFHFFNLILFSISFLLYFYANKHIWFVFSFVLIPLFFFTFLIKLYCKTPIDDFNYNLILYLYRLNNITQPEKDALFNKIKEEVKLYSKENNKVIINELPTYKEIFKLYTEQLKLEKKIITN